MKEGSGVEEARRKGWEERGGGFTPGVGNEILFLLQKVRQTQMVCLRAKTDFKKNNDIVCYSLNVEKSLI